ncbi:MAG: hypothetical protein VX007_05745 [Pseudomonadota bacterium]|nr:hypothetical protein [Pseudomonadota bacterium]
MLAWRQSGPERAGWNTSAVNAAEIPAKNRRIAAGGAGSLRAFGAQFARPVRTNELATGEMAEHL